MYSILAGLVSGLIAGFLSIAIASSIEAFTGDLMEEVLQLNSTQKAIVMKQVEAIMDKLYWVLPISTTIQMVLLTGLFGILHKHLIVSRNMKPLYSSIITGLSFIILIEIVPLLILEIMYHGVIGLMHKYIGIHMVLLPGILYTILLAVFTTKGPWREIAESKPKEY